MQNPAQSLSLAFAAGSLGAVANAILVWLLGASGINAALGVNIAPALTPAFIYAKVVWGGLWGFLFLLPFFPGSPVIRGVVYSFAPILVQLFVVFPFHLGKGMMGLNLGTLTPVFVIVVNIPWGVAASLWFDWGMSATARR